MSARNLLLVLFGTAAAAALRMPAPPTARQPRRDVLQLATGLAALRVAWPEAAAASPRGAGAPVLVLGANGKTGRECVTELLARGRPCIAATRSGDFELDGDAPSGLLRVAKGDVTSYDSLDALIGPDAGLGGVIFAASASKKGGSPKAVDEMGVIRAAQLCIATEVPRYVVVSSGGVSKPDSAVYKFLNFAANGIMDAKIRGEDEVRSLYASAGVSSKGVGYTIIRPGGLTTDAGLGVGAIELNQGDDKSGRIARADVAALCVECIQSKAALDTTFECYYAETAKGLNDVMASNAKGSTEATAYVSGKERRANTWAQLFEGLERAG